MKCTNKELKYVAKESMDYVVCGSEMVSKGVVNGFGTTIYQCPVCKNIEIIRE